MNVVSDKGESIIKACLEQALESRGLTSDR